jgi:hypothetical protein
MVTRMSFHQSLYGESSDRHLFINFWSTFCMKKFRRVWILLRSFTLQAAIALERRPDKTSE